MLGSCQTKTVPGATFLWKIEQPNMPFYPRAHKINEKGTARMTLSTKWELGSSEKQCMYSLPIKNISIGR